MAITWLSLGELEYGANEMPLPVRDGYGMAGYSLGGKKGRIGAQTLYARSLALRDHRGEEAVVCITDLMCPSLALFQAVAAKTSLAPERLVLTGTHTHTAPGHHYANAFYRIFAQPLRASALFRVDDDWLDALSTEIALGIEQSRAARQPGIVGVGQKDCFEAGRNRSEAPFLATPEAGSWGDAGFPAANAPGHLQGVQQAIDPRVTCIAARPAGAGQPAAFAFYGCHATALGPTQESYHRDWPGYAIDEIEDRNAGGVVAAVGLSAAGDITPLPPGEEEGPAQGEHLAQPVGEKVGGVVADILADLPTVAPGPMELHVTGGAFIRGDNSWDVGYPILYGAEDGRTELFGVVLDEGMRKRGGPPPAGDVQWPKRSVLPFLQSILRPIGLEPAKWHPVHRLHLGAHAFVTTPGEPTAVAAHRLERDLINTLGAITSATVLGYAGDYAGYFTTPEEYALQHYEGAHTLYGQRALALLTAAVVAPAPMPAAAGAGAPGPIGSLETQARLLEDAALGVSVGWVAAPAPGGPATLTVDGVPHAGLASGADIDTEPPLCIFVAHFPTLTPADVAGKTVELSGAGVTGALNVPSP